MTPRRWRKSRRWAEAPGTFLPILRMGALRAGRAGLVPWCARLSRRALQAGWRPGRQGRPSVRCALARAGVPTGRPGGRGARGGFFLL